MQGRILQGIGSFYTVESGEACYVCKARGRFRKQRITPMVGDLVEFTPAPDAESEGSIEEILPRSSELIRPPVANGQGALDQILPRKNRFFRPAVANIDLLLVTLAAAAPDPDLLLADRLLVRAQRAGIEACIVVNKTDLSENIVQEIRSQYEKSGYRVLTVCAREQIGLDELKALARGRIVAFAGQSAVGKSTLMNQIIGQKIAITSDTLKDSYPEFAPYEGQCRFLGCQHIGEPDCAVKQAAKEGLLSTERLERYALLHQEIKEKWGRRYD